MSDSRHPNYAVTLSNLAGVYEQLGRYAEAERVLLRALSIREAAAGDARWRASQGHCRWRQLG